MIIKLAFIGNSIIDDGKKNKGNNRKKDCSFKYLRIKNMVQEKGNYGVLTYTEQPEKKEVKFQVGQYYPG